MSAENAIVVAGLRKSFGKLVVLDGVDLVVPRGSVVGLLGPNGAGKTTTIRILSTLLRPDSGQVLVNGFDVVRDADAVRGSIGLTGQYAAVDDLLTGEENLVMMGRLYHLGMAAAKRRARELLEQLDLVEAGSRIAKTYSGGMRRRLDLAMSLVAVPAVLFLDEPTTGLDPRSRLALWDTIERLAAGGTTILLTTQHMEEADHLADTIVVIDHGKVIAQGTPEELKTRVGSERLELTLAEGSDLARAREAIGAGEARVDEKRRMLSVGFEGGGRRLNELLRRLEEAGVEVETVSLHRPTLDDVFLTLTGRGAALEIPDADQPA